MKNDYGVDYIQEGMSDVERLTWMEMRFGLRKTISERPNAFQNIDRHILMDLERKLENVLIKYRNQLKISMPVPGIKTFILNKNQINFIFFDKKTHKRILLGTWLAGKEEFYEW